jgi:hypothetical protein
VRTRHTFDHLGSARTERGKQVEATMAQQLLAGKKKSHPVWNYVKIIQEGKIDSETTSECNVCGLQLVNLRPRHQ